MVRQYHDGVDDLRISDAADVVGQGPEQDADDDRAPQLSKTEEQAESPLLDHLRGPRPRYLFRLFFASHRIFGDRARAKARSRYIHTQLSLGGRQASHQCCKLITQQVEQLLTLKAE